MDFKEYQESARRTAVYPDEYKLIYPTLGLNGEVGEFANRIKRVLRDRTRLDNDEAITKMGDILWYFAQLATELDLSLDEIAKRNLERLKEKDQIKKWD